MADYAPLKKRHERHGDRRARPSPRGVRERVRQDVRAGCPRARRPGSPPSWSATTRPPHVYVRMKRKACDEVGIALHPPRAARATRRQDEVAALLADAERRPEVTRILLQLPLPDHARRRRDDGADRPAKDVDGLTPDQRRAACRRAGEALVPCTPAGRHGAAARRRRRAEGRARRWCVGRSQLVGKPLAQLLLAANATVTHCHSRTRDLAEVCRRADVLVAAVGVPRPGHRGHGQAEGAVVIDVGTNRTDEGLVGDVDFEAVKEMAGAITPVPGGVGPDDDRDAAGEHAEGGAAQARLGRSLRGRMDLRRLAVRGVAHGGRRASPLLVVVFVDWSRCDAVGRGRPDRAWESFARHRRDPRAGGGHGDRGARGSRQRSPRRPCRSAHRRAGHGLVALIGLVLVAVRVVWPPGSPRASIGSRRPAPGSASWPPTVLAGGCLASIRDDGLPRRSIRSSRASCAVRRGHVIALPARWRCCCHGAGLVRHRDGRRGAPDREATEPTRGSGGRRIDRRAERGRRGFVAEGEEKNAWQADALIDRILLVAILAAVLFAVLTAITRAAGAKPHHLGPAGATALIAAVGGDPGRLPDHPGAGVRRRPRTSRPARRWR